MYPSEHHSPETETAVQIQCWFLDHPDRGAAERLGGIESGWCHWQQTEKYHTVLRKTAPLADSGSPERGQKDEEEEEGGGGESGRE